jgi:putative RecB family exonuclease
MDEYLKKPLSPSRANQFRDCELAFRYRSIDQLPEPPSTAAVRGNLVHLVLERLFEHSAQERTVQTAVNLFDAAFDDLLNDNPKFLPAIDPSVLWNETADFTGLSADKAAREKFIADGIKLVEKYFTLETPSNLEATHRELPLATTLDDGVAIHGIIDRVEINPSGDIRISDYKTGKSPHPRFQQKVWFQLLFYALLVEKELGTLPKALQLLYLGDGNRLDYTPSRDDIANIQAEISSISQKIRRSVETGIFEPKESKLCDYCHHQKLCPAKGGTQLPWPIER